MLLLCAAATAEAQAQAQTQAPAQAQRRDIRVAYSAYAYLDTLRVEGRGGLEDTRLESHLLRIRGQFGHLFKSTGTVFAAAFGYDQIGLRLRDDRLSPTWTLLHHLSLRLVVMQRLPRRWSLVTFLRPGIASDYHGVDGHDVRISAGVVARWALRPDLSLGFGALYNNGVFGHLVLPVLSVHYRWRYLRLRIDLPQRLALWLAPTPWFEAGLRAQFVAGRFGIHGDSRQALGDTAAPLYITLGAVSRWFLHRGFYVALEGGWLVRQIQLLRDGATTHRTLDFGGFFASATVGYLL